MFSFFKKSFNIDEISSDLISISNNDDFPKIKNNFENIISKIPLDGSSENDLNTIFKKFNNNQIKNFSNNLIEYMKIQMKEKIIYLNQSAEILLIFTISIYNKIKIREYIVNYFNEILKGDSYSILLKTFPFNEFIFCFNIINNNEFLYKKDVFQRELDKFDFIFRLTSVLFCIIHNKEINNKKNLLSEQFCDSVKLFVLIGIENENNFINIKTLNYYFDKLFNSTISNFTNLINNRVDKKIDANKFEIFLFMNLYIFIYLCLDNNKFIIEQINNKNTFNLKCILIANKLFNNNNFNNDNNDNNNNENDNNIKNNIKNNNNNNNNFLIEKINEYSKNLSNTLKISLLNSSKNFNEFINLFIINYNKLTIQFKILIKSLMIYCFCTYKDFCENSCLNINLLEFINLLSMNNAYDLILYYIFSNTENFYIVLKKEINFEEMFIKMLNNIINQRKNNNFIFTISIFFSLVTSKTLISHLNNISNETFEKIIEFFIYFSQSVPNSENLFDNLICLSIFYGIIFNIIKFNDSPSQFIYKILLIFDKIKNTNENYILFYKNNFEFEEKGKKIFENYFNLVNSFNNFFNKIKEGINKEGIDIKYSKISDIISIINKTSFNKNEINSYYNDIKIFGGESEKFFYFTIHTFDYYKIFE